MHWFEWLAFGFFMVGGAAIVTYSTLYLSRRGWSPIEILLPIRPMQRILCLIPNPPKDTDGRREDSGRGWVRELQGRWPGVLG